MKRIKFKSFGFILLMIFLTAFAQEPEKKIK
jgi:hypothetical protein